jgi:hypothetical protein
LIAPCPILHRRMHMHMHMHMGDVPLIAPCPRLHRPGYTCTCTWGVYP